MFQWSPVCIPFIVSNVYIKQLDFLEQMIFNGCTKTKCKVCLEREREKFKLFRVLEETLGNI